MQSRFFVASTLSDEDLLRRLQHLAADARHATADLVAHLAEVARRQAYLGQGYGSLFAYCTAALRLSEHAAYNRIEAARAVRRFPVILDRLAEGAVTLTTVRLLAPHLTAENHERLLAEASGLRKTAVEELLGRLSPRPDVPTSIRALPRRTDAAAASSEVMKADLAKSVATPTPTEVGTATGMKPSTDVRSSAGVEPRTDVAASLEVPAPTTPRDRATVEALAPERYLLKVTLPATTREKLRLLQDLFCREVPDGDVAVLIDKAFDELLAQGRRTKQAATASPRAARPSAPGSRHVPAAIERTVRAHDDDQCAFVSPEGRRCRERRFLEIHHREPFAVGGAPTAGNLSIFCRPHNELEARRFFGPLREHLPLDAERATRSRTSRGARDETAPGP